MLTLEGEGVVRSLLIAGLSARRISKMGFDLEDIQLVASGVRADRCGNYPEEDRAETAKIIAAILAIE